MKLYEEYRSLNSRYREQKHFLPSDNPYESPSRMIFEITPGGIAWSKHTKNGSTLEAWEESKSHEDSLSRIATKIRGARLARGSSIVINFWPTTLKIFPMMVGAGQRASSARILDEIVQINPDSLQLDPTLAYRVLDYGGKKTDVIGISTAGWELVSSVLPSGVRLSRSLASISTLTTLLEKIADRIPDPSLICLLEQARLHYFSIRQSQIVGMRVVSRSSLRDSSDLKNTLSSLQIDPPYVLFISLTPDSSDAEMLCHKESDGDGVETSLTDFKSLLEEYPALRSFSDKPQLPLTLIEPSKKKAPLGFFTREESQIIPLSKKEMRCIRLSKFITTSCVMASLLTIAACTYYILMAMDSPSWRVDINNFHRLQKEWTSFEDKKEIFLKLQEQLENTPRIDRMLSLLCSPAPPGITLQEITFTYNPSIKQTPTPGYEFDGIALSSTADINRLGDYVSHLANLLSIEFPAKRSSGEIKSTATDANTRATTFNFNLNVR